MKPGKTGQSVDQAAAEAGPVVYDPPRIVRRVRQLGKFDPKVASRRYELVTGSKTLTQQHMATDTDVNVIVRRFGPAVLQARPELDGLYGDFTGVNDFESALDRIDKAGRAFAALPAAARERFANDATAFAEYVRVRYAGGASDDEIRADLAGSVPVPSETPVAPVAPSAAPAS